MKKSDEQGTQAMQSNEIELKYSLKAFERFVLN
jgi:hypothetical protein